MNKNIKSLIENIVNFDVTDYQDEKDSIIDNHTINDSLYKYFPKTKYELQGIIIKKLKENKFGSNGFIRPDLSDINTSLITDMSNLFSAAPTDYLNKSWVDAWLIDELDLSTWNMSNVVNMYAMFYCCSALQKIKFPDCNTSSVTNISNMFFGCTTLIELDLSNFDTSNVTDMSCAFQGCDLLRTLDLTNWSTTNIKYMDDLFDGCLSLENVYTDNIKISDKFNTFKD